MSPLLPTLSQPELIQRILAMAATGVYRESIFEALQPVASKKHIGQAIKQAKTLGLRSNASLRDPELGTYYEVDSRTHRALQQLSPNALGTLVGLESPDSLLEKIVHLTHTLQFLVAGVAGVAIGLATLGLTCFVLGQYRLGLDLWFSALITTGIWFLQKLVVRRLI
jgi:hypothetical protein